MTPTAFLAAVLALALPFAAAAETTIYVSPAGSDAAAGTAAAPVATVARAAALVRTARAEHPADAVTVRLAAGDYGVSEPLRFGPADSGTAAAPVTWRGAERDRVRLLGAHTIDSHELQLVREPAVLARLAPAARGHVYALDLKAAGVRHASGLPDYSRDAADLFVLFCNDRRLPLSRWPNGEYGYTTMKRVVSSGDFRAGTPHGGTFEYRGDHPGRWEHAVADGVWLRGFWRVPWVAETLRVKAIDPRAHTITFAISTDNGIGSKYSALVHGSRVGDGKEAWYALNLIEEIDQPGEWAVDFPRHTLYVWIPDTPAKCSLAVADNDQPLLSFTGTSHVTLRDLTIGWQMGDAVTVSGGESIRIAGCRIENVGRRGVVIRGGHAHEVRSCDLANIGLTAIDVLGGDRRTLTPARHQILNNDIYRVALAAPVPALTAGLDAGHQQIVGCTIAHNRIHDASYGGVTFAGNDNVLEYNEVYRIGLDGGDLGGFYTTGGWTARGNVVRANFIHHAENANAVYMDDGSSGLLVEGNLIYKTESGIFIGGGSDNVARHNLIVGCARAFHVDDRGIARKYVATDPRLRGDLDSVPYRASPWRERYPALVHLLDRDPAVPHGDVLADNVVVGCETLARRSGTPASLAGFDVHNNIELPAAALADPDALDFTLLAVPGADSPGAERGLAARLPDLDLAHYGLEVDEFRPTVPPRDLALLRSGNTKRKAFDSQRDVDAYPR